LRVIGLQEEEGSSLEFLRRGYKVHPILAKQLAAASKRLLA
jgi:hypothetical protein